MFEELKKKTFKASLTLSILWILIGGGVGIGFASDAFYSVFGYADFEQLAPDEIKNQSVDFSITANFGCYLEEYEYNEDTGRSKTTDLYYVIWTGDENATDFRYMTVKIPPSFEKDMEAMADNTYNDMYSDPIEISGKIKKLSDEEYEYFVDFFEESGWTAEEIEEGTLPYYIDYYNSKASMNGVHIFMFVGGIALLVWGICRIIKGYKGGYMKKFEKDYTNAGYNESTIASDYNHAFSMTKKDTIKIGRLMTYHILGADIRGIPNNKIMWAYMNRVTHRTNGIKTGTSFSVEIAVDGQKNFSSISVPNEQTALSILDKFGEMFPWVVLGYSDQLKSLFHKDRAQFLSLRYNTCEHIAVEPGFEATDAIQATGTDAQ